MSNGKEHLNHLYEEGEILRLEGSKKLFVQEGTEQEGTCKICYDHTEEGDNLLITPCNCKGSAGLIHIDCLKNWLSAKLTRNRKSQ